MNRQERRRLAKTNPARPEEDIARGFALYRAGQLEAAEALFRSALRTAPSQRDGLRLLGELLADKREFPESIAVLRRLTAAQPGDYHAHYALGNALRLAGELNAAVPPYQTALRLMPGFAGAHHGLGIIWRQQQRDEDAARAFRRAVEAMPDWAVAWMDLGLVLAIIGDLAGAEAALTRATQLAPGLGAAHRHLAALRPGLAKPSPDLTARIPTPDRVELLFALGRDADASGAYDAAFGHFRAANTLLRAAQERSGLRFDRAKLTTDIDRIIAAFPGGPAVPTGDDSEAPVFIVGMPRAGSSLLEQIAASHSTVFGAGEHDGIGRIVRQLGWAPGPAWSADALRTAAQSYLNPLREKAGLATRIIDKMPDNIFQIGLIAHLFPRARIILCARDPRDIALSCYFQHFAQPLAFDTNLDDCAFRIAELARLQTHWQRTSPLRSTVLSYEALLAAPEQESRRLVEYLGVDWEPACLDFHLTKRSVRTASWAQVRQPLYQNAAGRWRHYAAHLPASLTEY
jgi:tetratricopeptide (TPR) repeat protein